MAWFLALKLFFSNSQIGQQTFMTNLLNPNPSRIGRVGDWLFHALSGAARWAGFLLSVRIVCIIICCIYLWYNRHDQACYHWQGPGEKTTRSSSVLLGISSNSSWGIPVGDYTCLWCCVCARSIWATCESICPDRLHCPLAAELCPRAGRTWWAGFLYWILS